MLVSMNFFSEEALQVQYEIFSGCDEAKWLGCFPLRVGKKMMNLWCFRFSMVIWSWFFYIVLGCWLFLSHSIAVRPQSSWKLSFSSEQCIGKGFFFFFLFCVCVNTSCILSHSASNIDPVKKSDDKMFKVQSQQQSKLLYSLWKISDPSTPGVYNTKIITVNATHFHWLLTVLLKQPKPEWTWSQSILLNGINYLFCSGWRYVTAEGREKAQLWCVEGNKEWSSANHMTVCDPESVVC